MMTLEKPITGTLIFSLSEKHRLTVPEVFRNRLGPEFFLKPLSGGRVLAFNERDFQTLLDLRPMDFRDTELSECWRVVPSQTIPSSPSSRIIIPLLLRRHMATNPGDEIMWMGAGEAAILQVYRQWEQDRKGKLWT